MVLSGCSESEVASFSEIVSPSDVMKINANDWDNNIHYRLNEVEKDNLFNLLQVDYTYVNDKKYKKIIQDEKNESSYGFIIKENGVIVDVNKSSTNYFIGIETTEKTYIIEITKEKYAEISFFVNHLERTCSPENPCI